MRLEVFENECARCGERFVSYGLPGHEYGPILFATKRGEIAAALPERDAVWNEVSRLVDEAVSESGLSDGEKAEIFDMVFSRTIDPAANGEPFFAWGRIPCPRCGAVRRSYFGPSEPPRFQDVEPVEVTHKQWLSRVQSDKQKEVEAAVQDWVRGSAPA